MIFFIYFKRIFFFNLIIWYSCLKISCFIIVILVEIKIFFIKILVLYFFYLSLLNNILNDFLNLNVEILSIIMCLMFFFLK